MSKPISQWFYRRFAKRIPVLKSIVEHDARLRSIEQQLRITDPRPRGFYALEAIDRQARGNFLHEKLVILGSGPSIAETTQEERAIIARLPTVAMNRYLTFWEMIGIWPLYSFIADSRGAGPRIFFEMCRSIFAQATKVSPTLIVEEYYAQCVPSQFDSYIFRRDDREGSNLAWGTHPEHRMFFHRGSLSSLLNIISVLRLARKVFLIGVDLNRPGCFFDAHKSSHPELFNEWDEQAAKAGGHATAVEFGSWTGSILDHWGIINENYVKSSMSLACLSASSALVEQGLCPYVSIDSLS